MAISPANVAVAENGRANPEERRERLSAPLGLASFAFADGRVCREKREDPREGLARQFGVAREHTTFRMKEDREPAGRCRDPAVAAGAVRDSDASIATRRARVSAPSSLRSRPPRS